MAVIDIQGFIDKLNNGEWDLDTWEAIVNSNQLTVMTRLNGEVPTWFGLQAALSAATGLVYTSKSAMDAAPGTKAGQAARVTEGADAGLYIWSGSAWVKTVDPITATRDGSNPVFVPGERGGVTSASPTAALAVVLDIAIHGAREGKEYHIDYIQNQSSAITPVTDGFTIMEYDAGTWDNPVQVIGRLLPVTINRDTNKQFIHIESSSGISASLLINPQALPPQGTAIRMSQPADAGYSWKISPTCYQYSDRSFVADLTSLNINRDNLYPFVAKKRNNIDPVAPSETNEAWMKAIVDVRAVNAREGKFYSIEAAYSPARTDYPCAWIITESDVENFETAYTGTRIITYTDPMPAYPAGQGLQTVIVRSARAAWSDIEFYITLDTDNLPASPLSGTTSTQSGYAYIISPDRYTLKQAGGGGGGSSDGSGEIQIEGKGNNAITATFNRDSAYNFEVDMQPNGANGLFNFRSTNAINRDDGTRTQLMYTNSDMVPPVQVLSNESNVDTIPSDQPQSGYTGGNHTSDGGTGGTPTAMMASIAHESDGMPVDGTKAFKAAATEHRVRWVNKVMAWNTKEIGRYVLDQIVTAVIRKGGVEIWCKVVALENITVSVDNGLQSFATGFDNILFYNGANKTSRVAITSGLTSGPFTTTGSGCFAASLKGSVAAGLQTVWYDRDFGVGDGSHIGGSAGRFRVNGGKIYGAAITSTRPITLAAGESYEWHMGISWSGLEGFDGIDSAVTAYVNNEPTLMYAKLNGAAGTIRAREGAVINGQTVGTSGYHTSEPAGAYMFPIIDSQAQVAVDQAKAYTDTSVAVVDGKYSNFEKYGVENPLRVFQAGDRSGLTIYRYTGSDENGLIVLTSTTSAAGYLTTISPRGLSPLGMVFRFSIKKVSGTAPDYVLSVNSVLTSTPSRYGEGRRIESPEFVTYEVDISTRADGSAWPEGDTINQVYIALSQPSAGEGSSIYHLKFFSYGYRDTPYPIRYTTAGGVEGKAFAPLLDNATSNGSSSNRWSGGFFATAPTVTSDENEKQQIRELSEAERAVAGKCKALIRAFKFNDAVALKGEDKARIHVGVIAQEVKAAFESEGLVAEDYALLCYDEWGGDDAIVDEDGNVLQEATPGQDRYGIRYEELLAFIIAAL